MRVSLARGAARTTRVPAAPPRARAPRRRASSTGSRPGRALEVHEEHVVAEPGAPRPRLDPRQVHARGPANSLQHVHEPARRLVAAAPEHDRGLRRPRPARPPRPRGASHTKRVALSGWSSTFGRDDVAVVQLGREAASRARRSRRPRGAPSSPRRRSTARSRARRSGGARAGSGRTARSPAGARPPARPSPATSSRRARSRSGGPGAPPPPRSARRSASSVSVSSVTADAALERVLDRHDRAVDGAVLDRHHGVVDRGVGDRLGAGGRRRPQRLLAVRPGGTEVARPAGQAPAGVPAMASSTACCSSGESSYSGLPSRTCFT